MPHGCEVVAITGQLLGIRGRVVGPHTPSDSRSLKSETAEKQNEKRTVDVEFSVAPPENPFGHALANSIQEKYFPSRDVCRALKISPSLLGKLVGMVLVEPGRLDFGLNLKRNGQYQLLGYVRKVADSGNNSYSNNNNNNSNSNNGNNGSSNGSSSRPPVGAWGTGDSVQVVGSIDTEKQAENESNLWEYSDKAMKLLFDYQTKFPLLFERLETLPYQKKYNTSELFLTVAMTKGKTPAVQGERER
jgi:hypothetical protein